MIKKPNFLIIGSMKGGTTVLYDYICMHPAVSRAAQKEIHYFSLYPYESLDWYSKFFVGASPDSIIGEASPTYFDVAYTRAIPMLIKSQCPDIKLILIVRDPIERAVSHFHHLRNVNKIKSLINIDINNFFSRPYYSIIKQTTEIDFYLHQVIDFSLYSRKLLTYLSVFSRDKILILTADELKNSANVVMNRVYSFLGVEDFYSPEFESVRYSSGKNSSDLNQTVRDHLSLIFDEDFQYFNKIAGLSYS